MGFSNSDNMVMVIDWQITPLVMLSYLASQGAF